MKEFFTKKRIAYVSILAVALITLIILLIAPIGSTGHGFWIYTPNKEFQHCTRHLENYYVTSPFTLSVKPHQYILVEQTIVFTLIGIIFVVFLVLFLVELVKADVFKHTHRPTKTELMQAQIDELQRQVNELKKND